MPKSKHRKLSPGKKSRRIVTAAQETRTGPDGPVYIQESELDTLRSHEDFIALAKVGRAVNALTFCMQCMADHPKATPVSLRQSVRSAFIVGGYIHETFKLAKSLQERYGEEQFFHSFLGLINDLTETDRYMLEE